MYTRAVEADKAAAPSPIRKTTIFAGINPTGGLYEGVAEAVADAVIEAVMVGAAEVDGRDERVDVALDEAVVVPLPEADVVVVAVPEDE